MTPDDLSRLKAGNALHEMKLLYFAAVKQAAGIAEETVNPPAAVTTVATLIDWLRARGGGPAAALRDLTYIRIAINQEYASAEAEVAPDDEIAFFPPVTGGTRW